MYEKNNGNGMSLDALLSQAGIPPEEVAEMLADPDEPKKSPEEKKADALKSAAALADLPGMPGFLKPTRSSLAPDAPKTEDAAAESEQPPAEDGTATATVDAKDSNGQAFKVTVVVSPDDETAKEAAALREGAVAQKPEPDVSALPYGNGSGLDARYYPQNQAPGSGFDPLLSMPPVLEGPLAWEAPVEPFGAAAPAVPFESRPSIPLGPQGGLAPEQPSAPMGAPSGEPGFGAVTYGQSIPSAGAAFGPVVGSFSPFSPQGQPALGADGFGIPADGLPLTDEEAAAQAAMAAQNAAMVDAMAVLGPDAVPEEEKKRFFGKKKREKAARKAAEEAAAYAAATAAAAEAAAAAEEAARRQPTAYIPTPQPRLTGPAFPDSFDGQPLALEPAAPLAPQPDLGFDALGTTQLPLNGPQGTPLADGAGQLVADMSGLDRLAGPMPPESGLGAPGAQDPSVTMGLPPVGAVMGPDGAYLADETGLAPYDPFGSGPQASGVTPEGVAALEAMRSEMNDASDSHRKRVRNVKIAVASVVGVIVAGVLTVLVLLGTSVISLEDLGINLDPGEGAAKPASSSSASASMSFSYRSLSSSSSASSSSSSSAAQDEPDASASVEPGASSEPSSPSAPSVTPSLAGDEVHHYTLTTIDGEHPAVTEVVTYNSEGICLQTAMDAVFSSATAAQAFVERVRSDYGSNFITGSVDGTTAHVVVNMQRAQMTRQQYEDALRGVVDDLTIERDA